MILWNDALIKREDAVVDIEDRGYQFGDGVYEVVRFYDRKWFEMDAHLERLEQSAQKIGIDLPYSLEQLKEYINALLAESDVGTGNVYIQVTRGVAPRNHPFPDLVSPTIVAYLIPYDRPLGNMQQGVKATLMEDVRWLRCDIKSINLLGSVLAKEEAKRKGCVEAILYRDFGVTEGSSTNIFAVKNKTLYTHPANNFILNGITRLVVIDLAKKLGYDVRERVMSNEDLLNAEEIFMTSTTAEITPIIKVDDHVVSGGKPGAVTKHLQEAFDALI
ncbi:MAG TPA: D-amino-acid transaminase [Pseudogracilibacillus sp.]|nr:D-amino-acid transaminase [Pseudogracilibacillus sp.]